MKRCPDCGLLVSSDRWLCKCGYEFDGTDSEAQPTAQDAALVQRKSLRQEVKELISPIYEKFIYWRARWRPASSTENETIIIRCESETKGLTTAIFLGFIAWTFGTAGILAAGRGHSLADGIVFLFFWLIGGVFALIGTVNCVCKNAGSRWGVWLLPRFLNYLYIGVTVVNFLMLLLDISPSSGSRSPGP